MGKGRAPPESVLAFKFFRFRAKTPAWVRAAYAPKVPTETLRKVRIKPLLPTTKEQIKSAVRDSRLYPHSQCLIRLWTCHAFSAPVSVDRTDMLSFHRFPPIDGLGTAKRAIIYKRLQKPQSEVTCTQTCLILRDLIEQAALRARRRKVAEGE